MRFAEVLRENSPNHHDGIRRIGCESTPSTCQVLEQRKAFEAERLDTAKERKALGARRDIAEIPAEMPAEIPAATYLPPSDARTVSRAVLQQCVISRRADATRTLQVHISAIHLGEISAL